MPNIAVKKCSLRNDSLMIGGAGFWILMKLEKSKYTYSLYFQVQGFDEKQKCGHFDHSQLVCCNYTSATAGRRCWVLRQSLHL